MAPYDELPLHPLSEDVVELLRNKTQRDNVGFFRVLVAYHWSVMASMMRCVVKTPDRGPIPVNMYALNLATSGSGKGHANNVMEDEIIHLFRHRYEQSTFPLMAQQTLPKLSLARARRKGSDPDKELSNIEAEFENAGDFAFSFDSATSPAVKQARHKFLLADAGALNLQIDEIGRNLVSNLDVLNTFLELFDVGKVRQKLTKNTKDNQRYEEIHGRTPANLLMFGTPNSLLNGAKTEEEFEAMLESGYARRCFFAYVRSVDALNELTPEEVLKQQMDTTSNAEVETLAKYLQKLANVSNMHTELPMSEAVTVELIRYRQACEKMADKLPDHAETQKAELSHRYFKALKQAGAYAFIDGVSEVTMDHLHYGIRLAEESGKAFQSINTRERPYVKLAKYIADVKRPVTQVDLVEDVAAYRGSVQQKNELMQLAVAWGYQNNVVIKRSIQEGIEFYAGESLEETNLKEMRLSYSDDLAYNYCNDTGSFDELHILTQKDGMHWATHHFKEGHRCDANTQPGFNLVVLDVEKSVSLDMARDLLSDYKALFYTTKRHTDEDHRFRIVLPTNYVLKLDEPDYKAFMNAIYDWLPFDVDRQTNQRSRKWLSHNGEYHYQDGVMLDVLPFIPQTSKNEARKARLDSQQDLDNLERWVVNNAEDGNRNNQLIKYAYILLDNGYDYESIQSRVLGLNGKLADALPEAEILSTIMVTVAKALAKRDS